MATVSSMKPLSIRLPENIRAKLQTKADAMGIPISDLGRMILIEKANESESPLAVLTDELRSNAALIIAALSESIDLDQARELVAEHAAQRMGVQS